jgi:hypothetical protein
MTIFITVALLIITYEIIRNYISRDTHIDENARIINTVSNMIQLSSFIVVLMTLLICLVSNRQAIVDLVNDGLKIEREFRRNYRVKAWNPVKILIIINSKDIIATIALTYFSKSANAEIEPISHHFVVPFSMIFRIFFSFLENFKIFSLFYLAHLLRTLNARLKLLKRIDPQSDFDFQQAFEGILKMYGRLLILAERICKVLKYHTTAILIYSLIVTTTKVLINKMSEKLNPNLKPFQMFWLYSSLTFRTLNFYSLQTILGINQHCIAFAVLLVYSQASMNKEISKTIHILQDKFYRRFGSEAEILTLNLLLRNFDERTSSMYTIDTPLICLVSHKLMLISRLILISLRCWLLSSIIALFSCSFIFPNELMMIFLGGKFLRCCNDFL